MTINEVLNYYRYAANAAKAIGASSQTFHNWRKKGYISYQAQLDYERVTSGKLKARDYRRTSMENRIIPRGTRDEHYDKFGNIRIIPKRVVDLNI